MDHLSPEDRQQVQRLLKDLSLFRRLPTVELDADARAYQFFACNPDVAVSIWRVMQISNVEMWQIGPNDYETDTNDGTQGRVEVLQRSPEGYLILCRGVLQSPALPKAIRAEALMHLQPRYPSPGKVVHHVDLFVCFPSQTVETIARLISPVSYRIADRNFEEISLFIEMMSGAMARQPGWVEQIAGQLDGVIAQRPQELLDVTAKVYVDAQKQRLIEQGEPVTLEAIRPPVSQQASSPETNSVR